jgi:hypothetical protein
MPVKVFGSKHFNGDVQARLDIESPGETMEHGGGFPYFRGGAIGKTPETDAEYGKLKIGDLANRGEGEQGGITQWADSTWASANNWVRGFYCQPDAYASPTTGGGRAPNVFQDGNLRSGAFAPMSQNPKELQVGFPGLAGTPGFLPLEAKINYVRYWFVAQEMQSKFFKDRGGWRVGQGPACPGIDECCDGQGYRFEDDGTRVKDDCWLAPIQRTNQTFRCHVEPTGNVQLPSTDESLEVTALQKRNVVTYFNTVSPVGSGGFVWAPLYFDNRGGSYTPDQRNWKTSTYPTVGGFAPTTGEVDKSNGYEPNGDWRYRSWKYRGNPFGNSGLPWTADYAQWCSFGLETGVEDRCDCISIRISEFAVEFGYDLQPWILGSRCGEAQPTTDGALLKGRITSSASLPAEWRFQYDTVPGPVWSNATPWEGPTNGTPQDVEYLVTGLPQGLYYYRLQARDPSTGDIYTSGEICEVTVIDPNCAVGGLLVM